LIWSVPEIIAKLSEQVTLGAGRYYHDGNAGRPSRRCRPATASSAASIGVGTLKVTIGKPA